MTLKQLETYVLLKEQRIESLVKSRSRNWLIALGIGIVLMTVLFLTVFKKREKPNNVYESQIRVLDDSLQRLNGKVSNLEDVNKHQDTIIMNLNEAYKNNRPTETRIIYRYEQVPNDVRNLDKSGLRNEVTNFK